MKSTAESNNAGVGRKRILSVDFWRGLALLTIFINHIPGNVFERITHRNFGFSDATEVFVLLAGVAAALAYLPRFQAGQAAATTFRILQRAFQLYMAHIFVIIVCAALIARAVSASGDMRLFESIHLDVLINDTIPGLIGMVSLGMQPGYMNILPLYIVMLLMAPVLFLLARKKISYALIASGALYLASQLLYLNLPNYPVPGWWFLNPLCWQFLFTIGIAVGSIILRGEKPKVWPVLYVAALAYVLISGVWIVTGFYPRTNPEFLPRFIWDFDKSNLFLPRLLHVLSLAYVIAYLPVEKWLGKTSWAMPIIVLGRHSLPVFCLGTVLSINAQVVRVEMGASLGLDVILISTGIVAQLALAGLLEWYRSGTAAFSPALSRKPASRG